MLSESNHIGDNSIWQGKVETVIRDFGKERQSLLPALEATQETLGFIPEETVGYLAERYGLPAAEIYSVISFYGMLTTEKNGKYAIKVCDSLSCHINQAPNLIKIIGEELHIKPGETSRDGLFSLETVDCLGMCDQAPVMMVNDEIYGKLDDTALKNILKELRSKG